MATLEWAQVRGRELIASEIIVLDASSTAEFLALGVSGVMIGASVSLNVGFERGGIPIVASIAIDGEWSDIELAIAAELLHGSAPLSNRDTARLVWGSIWKGTEEATIEVSAGDSSVDEPAQSPVPAPPARSRVAVRAKPTIPSPVQAEMSMSKAETQELALSMGASARAFAEARAPSVELVGALQSVGLEGQIVFLGKANITSLNALIMHTMDELEDSLRRPQAQGKSFVFSPFERRMLFSLGVEGGVVAAAAAPGPLSASLDFGGQLFDVAAESTAAPPPPSTVGGILSGCTHAAALLGAVGGELDEAFVAEVLTSLADAAQSASSAPVAGSSMSQLVDKLDLLLESLCEKGALALESLTPTTVGRRSAAKLAAKLTMRVEEGVRARKPSVGGGDGSSFESLSRVLTAAHSPRLSPTEEKVAEELSASQSRLEAVARDPKAMAALSNLSALFETKESETVKLATYATVATNMQSIAALLKASHVKEPRGEFSALCPQAELCVRLLRVVKNGVRSAQKAILRRFLPPSADTSSLVEAALHGQLGGESACSVSELALATKPKVWLGVAAAAASNAAAASKSSQLVVLLKALPLISFSLMQMQPEDTTIAVTMMDVMANVARGVAVRSVGETVAGLLVPMMRAYGEAFDTFQKSATVAIPILGEVWAKERLESTVTAFMASVGSAEATPGSTSSAPVGAAQPEAVSALEKKLEKANKRLDALAKQQRGFTKALSDGSDDEEGEGVGEKTLANRAKRKAKKEAKERKGKASPAGAEAAE